MNKRTYTHSMLLYIQHIVIVTLYYTKPFVSKPSQLLGVAFTFTQHFGYLLIFSACRYV